MTLKLSQTVTLNLLVFANLTACSIQAVTQEPSVRPTATLTPATPVAIPSIPAGTPPGSLETPVPVQTSAPATNADLRLNFANASSRDLTLETLYQLRLNADESRIYKFQTRKNQVYSCSVKGPELTYDLIPDVQKSSLSNQSIPLDGLHSIFVAPQQNAYLRIQAHAETEAFLICQSGKGTVMNVDSLAPGSFLLTTGKVGDKVGIFGRVYDTQGLNQEGVLVRARSLDQTFPSVSEIITDATGYALTGLPAGVKIELTTSKRGYGIRRQVLIADAGQSTNPELNHFDFGVPKQGMAFAEAHTAISLKPDVSQFTPNAYSVKNSLETMIGMTFAKSVERESVERNFVVYALSPDDLDSGERTLLSTIRSGQVPHATAIWDRQAFDISWNPENSEVVFRFKSGYHLPSTVDRLTTPDYLVCLNRTDGLLTDLSGFSRLASEPKFKITPGDFETCGRFGVVTDQIAPQAVALQAPTTEQKNVNKVGLIVSFSEAMQLPTLDNTLAGGLSGDTAQAPAALGTGVPALQAAGNYRLTLTRNGKQLRRLVPWSSLGGEARRDPNDPRKVLLSLPDPRTILLANDEVEIEVAASVQDPAGNVMDPRAKIIRMVYPAE